MSDYYEGPVINTGCSGIFGFVFGHRYEPRYTETQRPLFDPQHPASFKQGCGTTLGAAFEAMKLRDKQYVGDVCRRCGRQKLAMAGAQGSYPNLNFKP